MIKLKKSHLSAEDVGKFFTRNGTDIWQMTSSCRQPTATLKNLQTNEETGGAVGCLNLSGFTRLIPEIEDDD